jgi:hypothetical protein
MREIEKLEQLVQSCEGKQDWEIRNLRKEVNDKILKFIQENLDCPKEVKEAKQLLKKVLAQDSPKVTAKESLRKRNITQDLLEILHQENIKSQNSLLILESSNDVLRKSDLNMEDYSRKLGQNSKIVEALGRKETRERMLLVLGLIVFFSSVIYIIYKRF